MISRDLWSAAEQARSAEMPSSVRKVSELEWKDGEGSRSELEAIPSLVVLGPLWEKQRPRIPSWQATVMMRVSRRTLMHWEMADGSCRSGCGFGRSGGGGRRAVDAGRS